MRIATRDRLWLLGGLVVALLLTVIAWQFFIKSQDDKTNSVKNDIATAQQQVLDSTHQLNQLQADSANLDKYKAALAAEPAALPADDGMPAFLRELHDAGDATGVGDRSAAGRQRRPLVTGAPAGATPVVSRSRSTMVATGPTDNLTAFLKQLQAVQPRAVLHHGVAESPGRGGQSSLSLTFEVFIDRRPHDGRRRPADRRRHCPSTVSSRSHLVPTARPRAARATRPHCRLALVAAARARGRGRPATTAASRWSR